MDNRIVTFDLGLEKESKVGRYHHLEVSVIRSSPTFEIERRDYVNGIVLGKPLSHIVLYDERFKLDVDTSRTFPWKVFFDDANNNGIRRSFDAFFRIILPQLTGYGAVDTV